MRSADKDSLQPIFNNLDVYLKLRGDSLNVIQTKNLVYIANLMARLDKHRLWDFLPDVVDILLTALRRIPRDMKIQIGSEFSYLLDAACK